MTSNKRKKSNAASFDYDAKFSAADWAWLAVLIAFLVALVGFGAVKVAQVPAKVDQQIQYMIDNPKDFDQQESAFFESLMQGTTYTPTN